MKSNYVYSSYMDFLKDKKFIQWQLMSDENLCVYWDDFSIRHPLWETLQAYTFRRLEGMAQLKYELEKRNSPMI